VSVGELSLVFGAALVGALWWWAVEARDRVNLVCREVCRDLDVQRLDETVSLRRLRLARDGHGVLAIERVFGFEFSVNGADRHPGEICLRGVLPRWVHLDHPDGPIHIDVPGRESDQE